MPRADSFCQPAARRIQELATQRISAFAALFPCPARWPPCRNLRPPANRGPAADRAGEEDSRRGWKSRPPTIPPDRRQDSVRPRRVLIDMQQLDSRHAPEHARRSGAAGASLSKTWPGRPDGADRGVTARARNWSRAFTASQPRRSLSAVNCGGLSEDLRWPVVQPPGRIVHRAISDQRGLFGGRRDVASR